MVWGPTQGYMGPHGKLEWTLGYPRAKSRWHGVKEMVAHGLG